MSDTRVQAANILCKIFLHYLVLLSEWDGMLDLWLRILDVLDRLMNSGQGDNLEEAVPESLKNILLVMADGGFIEEPVDGKPRTKMWEETVKRVDRFVPELIGEIFPKSREVSASGAPAAEAVEGKGEEEERMGEEKSKAKGETRGGEKGEATVEDEKEGPPAPAIEEVQDDGGVD